MILLDSYWMYIISFLLLVCAIIIIIIILYKARKIQLLRKGNIPSKRVPWKIISIEYSRLLNSLSDLELFHENFKNEIRIDSRWFTVGLRDPITNKYSTYKSQRFEYVWPHYKWPVKWKWSFIRRWWTWRTIPQEIEILNDYVRKYFKIWDKVDVIISTENNRFYYIPIWDKINMAIYSEKNLLKNIENKKGLQFK